MSRSGTRHRRDALRAHKCFAPAKPWDGRNSLPTGQIKSGAPTGPCPVGTRDIILAGCLINYYAQ